MLVTVAICIAAVSTASRGDMVMPCSAATLRTVPQVTAIFTSSLEVMVSVYGEHPEGPAAAFYGNGSDDGSGNGNGDSGRDGADGCGSSSSGGGVFHCADAFLTVVAVDGHGGPVVVPFTLRPASPAEVSTNLAAG